MYIYGVYQRQSSRNKCTSPPVLYQIFIVILYIKHNSGHVPSKRYYNIWLNWRNITIWILKCILCEQINRLSFWHKNNSVDCGALCFIQLKEHHRHVWEQVDITSLTKLVICHQPLMRSDPPDRRLELKQETNQHPWPPDLSNELKTWPGQGQRRQDQSGVREMIRVAVEEEESVNVLSQRVVHRPILAAPPAAAALVDLPAQVHWFSLSICFIQIDNIDSGRFHFLT